METIPHGSQIYRSREDLLNEIDEILEGQKVLKGERGSFTITPVDKNGGRLQPKKRENSVTNKLRTRNYLQFPFGFPGGGPAKRISGFARDYFDMPDARFTAGSEYANELRREILEKKVQKLREKKATQEGSDSFVQLMQKYSVGRPKRDEHTGALLNQHLPTSDATNIHKLQARQHDQLLFGLSQRQDHNTYLDPRWHKERRLSSETCRLPGVLNAYGTELLRAVEERNHRRDLERLRDRQEELTHVKTCKDLWANRPSCSPSKAPHHSVGVDNACDLGFGEEIRHTESCPLGGEYWQRAYELKAPYGTDLPSEARQVTENQSNF